MLTLAFSSEHRCACVQPRRAAGRDSTDASQSSVKPPTTSVQHAPQAREES